MMKHSSMIIMMAAILLAVSSNLVNANEAAKKKKGPVFSKCDIPTVLKIYDDSLCKKLNTVLTEKYQQEFNATLRLDCPHKKAFDPFHFVKTASLGVASHKYLCNTEFFKLFHYKGT